jgi:hypothetical protein
MLLRSPRVASNLSDPDHAFTLEAYESASKREACAPVPLDTFVEYGRWFRHQLGSDLDERNVLRIHHLDGLSLEETAAACRIGRSTAARWLAKARESILRETHRLLSARLRLTKPEVLSMLRLVQSEFDVSIHRYLGGPTGAEAAKDTGTRG